MDDAPPPHAAPPPTRRRRVLVAVGLLVLLATAALAVDLARQRSTVEAVVWAGPAALRQPDDGADTRPTLIRFTADWCPPCRAMRRDVFTLPDLATGLQQSYRAVSVDLTDPGPDEQRLAQRYAIDAIPSFVVLGPDGTETGRLVGGADAASFSAFLERHAAR